jgi:DNA-binding NarL/FixJ family response regulator
MQKIRVLIADDQRIVRFSLSNFLRAFEDMEPVGEAANGQQAVQLCTQLHPDVVLMDIKMPDMDGIDATRQILQINPHSHVVLLTALPQQEMKEAAVLAGVSEYVCKNDGIEQIAAAIRRAFLGAAA